MKKISFFSRLRRKLKLFIDTSWGSLRLFFSPHCKKSFSQCGEDIIVKYIFDALGIINPSYIDIGAHHPFQHSNTALFHLLGSKGVNIEPDPDLFEKFPENRPGDLNLNYGIAKEENELDFFVMKNRTLNTFSRSKAEEYKSEQGIPVSFVKKIPVFPLAKIVESYGNGGFWDFLSIDVEGFELEILKSHDWEKSSPKVICCETLSFSNFGKGVKEQSLIDFIASKGYMVYADTNVNTIFVLKDLWES